jgi:hypothetical protein
MRVKSRTKSAQAALCGLHRAHEKKTCMVGENKKTVPFKENIFKGTITSLKPQRTNKSQGKTMTFPR